MTDRDPRDLTPRIGPCEICRSKTDRRVPFEQRPRNVFLCSDDCERIFRMRVRATADERRGARQRRR